MNNIETIRDSLAEILNNDDLAVLDAALSLPQRMEIVIVNIRILPATNTKGTRMKVWKGRAIRHAETYGYHSVNSYIEAATKYMKTRYKKDASIIAANWEETPDGYTVALIYDK